jgi:hypothetical protein
MTAWGRRAPVLQMGTENGWTMKRGVFGLLLMLCLACAKDDDEPAKKDAGAADAGKDAGPQVRGDASLDLHALLIAALIETERTLIARCPCLTEAGQFESMQACVRALSLGRTWVDCANALDLTGMDHAQVRANLHCSLEELTQRTECLTGSGCASADVAACMSQSLGCPQLPLDLLSRVAVECSIGLSH